MDLTPWHHQSAGGPESIAAEGMPRVARVPLLVPQPGADQIPQRIAAW